MTWLHLRSWLLLSSFGFLAAAAVIGACSANPPREVALQVVAAAPSSSSSSAGAQASAPAGSAVEEQAETPALQEPMPTAVPVFVLPTVTPAPAATATATAAPTATPLPPFELTPDGVQRTVKLPILMYHYVSTPPVDADVYRLDLSTPPNLFAAQLDRLQAEGYTTISLYQLLAHLTQGAPLPPKPVVITFDDGYRDNYENAFPLLAERGMTATFFVVTDFIDEQRPLYLSWEMAREMLAAGMSIESHGRNHATLEGQDDDYLVWQALGSLETLQYELGVRPRFISYPAGDYDGRTIDVFRSANYWGGVTTEQGEQQSSDRPFEFERIRMRNTTTPDDLVRYLEADW